MSRDQDPACLVIWLNSRYIGRSIGFLLGLNIKSGRCSMLDRVKPHVITLPDECAYIRVMG